MSRWGYGADPVIWPCHPQSRSRFCTLKKKYLIFETLRRFSVNAVFWVVYYIRMSIYGCIYIYIYIHACLYIYIYACMSLCIYIYIYIWHFYFIYMIPSPNDRLLPISDLNSWHNDLLSKAMCCRWWPSHCWLRASCQLLHSRQNGRNWVCQFLERASHPVVPSNRTIQYQHA